MAQVASRSGQLAETVIATAHSCPQGFFVFSFISTFSPWDVFQLQPAEVPSFCIGSCSSAQRWICSGRLWGSTQASMSSQLNPFSGWDSHLPTHNCADSSPCAFSCFFQGMSWVMRTHQDSKYWQWSCHYCRLRLPCSRQVLFRWAFVYIFPWRRNLGRWGFENLRHLFILKHLWTCQVVS